MIASTLDTPLAAPRIAGGRALPAELLMALSGAAALGWQAVWTTQLGAGLGHEVIGVLAVLAAFFGGLALGAFALGRTLAASCRPGRWYAGCEAVLLLWGLGLAFATPQLMRVAAGLIGAEPSPLRHWAVAFGVPFVLLLPASAAMGATLPALERLLAGERSRLGALYAANTFGATAGVLFAVFVALPTWGLQGTAWACAGANAACVAIAWWLWGGVVTAPASPASSLPRRERSRLTVLLVLTGFLGIGVEVVAVRVLSQVGENTVYSYALILATYLLGTAAGAAIYQRLSTRLSLVDATRDRLLALLSLAVGIGAVALFQADALSAWPAATFGPGVTTALAGEALAAAAAMTAPTLVMGALFTHLCRQAQAAGAPLGRSLALNTAGAAAAPLVFGVVLLPALGAATSLVVAGLGYLALQAPARWTRPASLGLAVALCAGGLLAGPLRFVDVPDGGRILSYRDGVMAAVSVVEDGAGVARLRINNRAQEGSSASGTIERRLALLPLLLHPAPQRALFLGLGTGFTAAAAAEDAALRVDAVELLPEVIEASTLFAALPAAVANAPKPAAPVRVVAADARRFVQESAARYDVVVADLFHPARSGAGSLYTVEQFAAVRARLAPGGLYCQWLALHQMEPATLRSIVAAFLQVYPDAIAVLAGNSLDTPVLGLVARPDAPGLDLAALRQRLAGAPAAGVAAAGLDDAFAVPGSVVAGPAALARFAGDAAANSDDRPLVAHRAPWAAYAPQTTPRQRLLTLLAALEPTTADVRLVAGDVDARRVAAYWSARRRYIELGASLGAAADPAAMLARVEAPLLALLHDSPEFRPADDTLRSLRAAVPGHRLHSNPNPSP